MATFNSLEKVYADIMKNLGIALRDTLEEAKTIAYEYILRQWYNKYPVKEYERLGLMLDSLQSKYEIKNNTLIATLYIKNDELHSVSKSWNKKEVTYEYLYEWFSENYKEQGILDYTQEQLDDLQIFINIIRDTLNKAGYNFS